MTCSEVREQLSAYYDGELAEPLREAVAEHLEQCARCRAEITGFRKLSELTAELRTPEPPAEMWQLLERQLDTGAKPVATRYVPWRVVTIAAVLLVGASLSLLWWSMGREESGHAEQDRSMAAFLQEFAFDPSRAQQTLVQKYEGQPLEAENAVEGLRYTPVATHAAPDGYKLQGAVVLKMPCCKCVQTIYTRGNGSAIAVFEHDDEQPAWFRPQPTITARCNGKPTTLVEVNRGLAATWKCGSRCITVIGANDINEVVRLMSEFDMAGTDAHRGAAARF